MISEILNEGSDVVRHNVFTVGNNAYHAHPFPSTETILEHRNIVCAYVGGLVGGQVTDIARMAVVGKATLS